ncbi:hypothetical protein GGS23DRAFT_372935 [Durotheca rogersii]|uniref:uncharacterized protein n=1 Tax=Durotheca rogersii TaxID=419775 RepID=UPI00221EC938|nr:uncharacterized protein GGS23DRAFT_372935 [Durotheca rogersii]KAI5866174.1 hypothetical protein GGS23DRAFT_372935 [Durotheca rogersii]
MRFTAILSLATATAATIQESAVASSAEEYIWQIDKWQAGQSHGHPEAPVTGWYNFNVSAAEYGEGPTRIPAFHGQCEGYADGKPLSSNYTNCRLDISDSAADATVISRVLPDPDFQQAHITVHYLFNATNESKTRRNFTIVIVEDWARERPPHNFTVTPEEIL